MKDLVVPFVKNKMRTGLFIIPILFLILFFPACKTFQIQTEYEGQGGDKFYYFYNIKAKVKQNGKKKSFRIFLKYNSSVDRIIFLGPLNQVLFESFVRGEETLLIISRKKKYWKGRFSDFLNKFWNLDMTYFELKNLLLNGIMPEKKDGKIYPDIEISRYKNRYTQLKISLENIFFIFKVSSGKKRKGRIKVKRDLSNYSKFKLGQMELNGK